MPRVTAAAEAAHTRTRRRKLKVVTNGVACYLTGADLLIVPIADVPHTANATRTRMPTQKTTTWDVLHSHPIAKELEADAQLALLCEYIDLADELEGMSLSDYIDSYFAAAEGDTPAPAEEGEAEEAEEAEESAEGEPSSNGDGAAPEVKAVERPKNMTGLRVVYRFPGQNILSDAAGVTRDSNGTVDFTDVDDGPWTNVTREKVFPVDVNPDLRRVIHVIPREAKEIKGWLESGKPAKGHPEGGLLRSLFYEFTDHTEYVERCALVVMNGKKPYVDRFVQLPNNGFEDDQKPTTRLFGEHCFRVRGKDYVIEVVTP